MVQIEVDIVGYIKIEIAVIVIVAEGCAGTPTSIISDPGFGVTSVNVPSPLLW